jgi:predicted metal-dependent hydrolase
LSVRVFRDGVVEIVVPPRTGPRHVRDFVDRHRDWIERHLRRSRLAPPEPFPPHALHLAALGERWECVPDPDLSGVRVLRQATSGAPGALRIGTGPAADRVHRALVNWLIRRAREAFAPLLAAEARSMACEFRLLQIRRQRGRWGSCSARGTISLNCCLLFQEPGVVRYLLVHELSHLTHMNHSQRFWEHVVRHEPRWRELDRRLRRGWEVVPAWVLTGPPR